jgi:hypothetical protein
MRPPKNLILICDFDSCLGEKSCELCEQSFPGFQSKYKGRVIISDWAYNNQSKQINEMRNICPEKCINLNEYIDK